ncbi:hypothetical protein D9M73_226570 [compost metagenome]
MQQINTFYRQADISRHLLFNLSSDGFKIKGLVYRLLLDLKHNRNTVRISEIHCCDTTLTDSRMCYFDGALDILGVIVFATDDNHILKATGHIQVSVFDKAHITSS